MFAESDPVSGSTKTVETERVKVRQMTVCEKKKKTKMKAAITIEREG